MKKPKRLYFFLNLSNTKSKGAAVKVEEYVPAIVPTKRANTNHLIVTPPSKNSAKSIKIIVKELLRERVNVSFTALFTKP